MGIYFDHNATTPMDPEVLDAMRPYFETTFGNPSSIHLYGQAARRGLDRAREEVAALIGADPEEIVFTSGGTESDNHAILGTVAAHRKKRHLITSEVEHQAVLEPMRQAEAEGCVVTRVGVSADGAVDPHTVADAITEETALVSVMAANNDVGTIQPITEIATAAKARGVPMHSDAVQAAGKIPLDVNAMGVALLTFSSHKIYGPKGAGALFVRRGTRIAPILHGGHQESRRRGGTENLPAIVGFGKACTLAKARLDEDATRVAGLRDRLERGLIARVPGAEMLGSPSRRVPGALNMGFPGVEGEALLMVLDLRGVAVSTGSACTSESHTPSHVLAAMGVPAALAAGSVRFSLGRGNTEAEVDRVIDLLADAVARLRGL